MKSEKSGKKLKFGKSTVADLNGSVMGKIKGGEDAPTPPCLETFNRSGCPTGTTCESVCSGLYCC